MIKSLKHEGQKGHEGFKNKTFTFFVSVVVYRFL